MDRKKKTIIIVVALIVVLIVIGLLIVFSPNLINRLTGNVNDANNANNDGTNTSEFVNNVCNVVADNENFLTFSGTIIEDFGDEGTALITIRNDNMVLTKEVTVKSNEYTNFNYVLPRGTYNVTVTKAGYETYETQIKESTNLDITLHSSGNVIVTSNRVFHNVYYDFYSDGTIHLKTIGNFNINDAGVESELDLNLFLLSNIFIKHLQNKGFNVNLDDANDPSGLGRALFAAFSSAIVSNQSNGRQPYIDAYQKIESGACNANNMLDEDCDFDKLVFNLDDYLNNFEPTFDYAKRFIKVIVDMPTPTNLIIDDSVAFLPTLMLITAPELTINDNILGVMTAPFIGAKIGTLTVNSNVLAQTENFAAQSQINNLIIGEGVTSIGKKAFNEAIIDNITLPSTLTEIGASAFEDANINAITIPENVTTINERVFQDATLTEVKLPSGLTSIGQYAFYGTELTSITIPASVETIGKSAFANSSLSEVKLSKELKTIEESAFYETKLTSITIPASVTSIGNGAFSRVPLTEIIIEGDKTRFNSNWASIGFPANLKPSE